MAETLERLVRQLARAFWGRIVVKPLCSSRDLEIRGGLSSRDVPIHPLRPEGRVASAAFVRWRNLEVQRCGSWLGRPESLEVRGGLSWMGEARTRGAVRRVVVGWRLRIGQELDRIRILPHERTNRLGFLKNLPRPEGASLLEAFSPIIKGLVARSVLDKRSGKLWVWYRPSSVREAPQHLALLRVAADRENPLRWVWLPARKGSPRNPSGGERNDR